MKRVLLALIFAAVFLFALKGRGQEKPAYDPKITSQTAFRPEPPQATQVQPIPATYMERLNALLLQQRILELELCADAGIHYRECRIDWQRGVVSGPERKP